MAASTTRNELTLSQSDFLWLMNRGFVTFEAVAKLVFVRWLYETGRITDR